MLGELLMVETLLILAFLVSVEPFSVNRATYAIIRAPFYPAISECYTKCYALPDSLMEDGVTLNSLSDTHADGIFLKESIQRWLDEEYIPQDVHRELGEEVRKVYVSKRNAGNNPINFILVGHILENDLKLKFWPNDNWCIQFFLQYKF